jgi:hypothetical protein
LITARAPVIQSINVSGNVIDSRTVPRTAGFGVATAYQNPRTLQAQIRFSF